MKEPEKPKQEIAIVPMNSCSTSNRLCNC